MSSHKIIHRVQYYETDAMGIVHHSNYIRWFETARTEFLRNEGIPYSQLEDMKLMAPVTGVECNYKYAAKYDDEVVVNTKLIEFNGIRFKCQYEVYCKDKLIVTGSSLHVFTNEQLRPINIRKAHIEIYEKMMGLLS